MEKINSTSSYRARKVTVNVLIHILLAVLSFVWIFPVLWIIMTSFRAEQGSYVPYFFPKA